MSSKAKPTTPKPDGKPALTPKLRFPEFRDAAGWSQVQLIDTTDRSVKWSFIGGPFGSNLKSSDYVDDGVRIIQLQNIGDGEFCAGYRIFTSIEKADELLSNNIYPGDIIMSKMGDPVGRACLIPDIHERYVMCSDGIRLVVNEDKNDKYFIYSLINSPPFRSVVEKTATGSTRKRIGLDELKSLPMWLPKKPEQQKIAECLSSVDELIAAQARKLDALKTHKKGLMQQLFPREGETQPRLRFPEFQATGEWAESTVEEIIATVTPPKKLQTSDYQTEGAFPIVDQSQDYICGWTDDTEAVIDKGLPVIVFGDHTCALKFIDRPFVQGADGIKILRPKRGFDVRFLFCALEANPVMQETYKRHFSLLKEKKLSFPDPKSGEQQRIADCLTSLDDLIAAQTQKLDALKTHKKGLMQQLFPSAEEVEA